MAIAVPLRRSSRSDEGARTAALYRAHGAELLRFAWHRLGRLEDAEDAVQATFLSAHRVLVEGEQIREPRAWLFRILRNECLTRIATTKRRGVPDHLEDWHADAAPGVAEQVEQREEFDTTVALLASLPGPQRDALVLREWLGLSSIETATIIDSTPQGVDALIYRARKSLVAVPDADDQSTCADTRRALAADEITVRTRAHLVGCRSCRAAALRLRAPEEVAVANGILPLDSLAEGLGVLVPGFAAALGITILGGATATAATTAATAAGTTAGTAGAVAATTTATVATATVGTATATTAVASGAALGAKVAVGLALGVGVAGGTVATVPAVREAITPIVQIEGERPQAKPPRIENGDGKRVAVAEPPPAAALAGSAVEPPRTPKGVEAGATSKDATSGAPPAEAGAVEAASAAAAAAVVAEPTAPAVAEESNAGAAAVANVVAAPAVEAVPEVEKAAAKAALVAEEKAKREAERVAEKARLEAERVEKAAAKAALVAEEKAKREAERAAEKFKREAERAATATAKASKSEGSGGSVAAVMGASS